ncbi:MAG: aspartate aminotransferase family protein, partial [Deltaproteobacteria bacterium]|nr:aspartate aminotransferase family protein [Deltaproteobacteria bacterium]
MEIQEVFENMFLPLSGFPPILITKAEGVYLYDSSGARFIDASGGPMAVTIGYGRKEVAEAAKRVLEQVSYILPVFASEARIELVKRIKKLMPPELNQVYFCSGGSEANEAAIKFARQYHVLAGREAKYKIVSRNLSYHGMTLLALSIGDVKVRQRDFIPMLFKNPRVEPSYCYRCPFGKEYPGCDIDCAFDLEKKILEEGPETVMAFIAEPIVASAGGGLVPPPEYFPIIRETCDKYDVLLIVDEVVTGFGRTGKNMGMDHFNVVPDIATFAKGTSSAYAPLAGMAVKEELTDLFKEKEAEFQHLYTFSGHPLSCAIGNEVQRIIEEEGLIGRAEEMGQYLEKKLLELEEFPMVGNIRGKGMLWAIEFVKDKATKEPFPKDKNVKMNIIRTCFL